MKSYETVWEIFNECANNQMRDVFIDEIETDDIEGFLERKFKGKEVTFEKQVLKDGTIVYDIMASRASGRDIHLRRYDIMRKKIRNWLRNCSRMQVIGLGFILLILCGTILLMLPVSTKGGVDTGVMDALFTATSASCVTGLVRVDTANHWSLFGQIVILLLIQTGGLGFMTISVLFPSC